MVSPIKKLRAPYEVKLLILSTGACFQLKIPNYLSKKTNLSFLSIYTYIYAGDGRFLRLAPSKRPKVTDAHFCG